MRFTVYFEIYGKLMKTTVEADNVYEAETKVRNRLNIKKIEKEGDTFDAAKELFNKMGLDF